MNKFKFSMLEEQGKILEVIEQCNQRELELLHRVFIIINGSMFDDGISLQDSVSLSFYFQGAIDYPLNIAKDDPLLSQNQR